MKAYNLPVPPSVIRARSADTDPDAERVQFVRTATGKTTLLAVRKRVNDIAQMCP